MTGALITIGAALGLLCGMGLFTAGYLARAHETATRCQSCGHGPGFHDTYTGKCTAQANTAWWLHRLLGVRKLTACKCVRREVTT
jgi:hypothetical protein